MKTKTTVAGTEKCNETLGKAVKTTNQEDVVMNTVSLNSVAVAAVVEDMVNEICDTSELISLMTRKEIRAASRTRVMRANLEASQINTMVRECRLPFEAYEFVPKWQKQALRKRLEVSRSRRNCIRFHSVYETNDFNSAA
ncbi:MAG: hypothetical protein A2283_08890 [Lentisphaerae bacterium RIFOXYA12_FULL_48_11]|nr:MAG: hypothetical protein A2283_08890 [Lentisphaerae bacterium RIFOXYA12_FULL_48_11]